MTKVYEPAIDPDEFIRTFRDEPSALSTLKNRHSDENAGSKSQTDNLNVKADQTNVAPIVSENAIEDYRKRFLLDKTYLRPRLRFLMVEINPDFIQKIKRIISYESDSPCSIKSFVNNVLADHSYIIFNK